MTLSAPASCDPDPRADLHATATPDADDGCSNASQDRSIREMLNLLLLKPAVQVILWDQLVDSRQHRFPTRSL